MDFRAQAGLEYLMTYGWALVLISVVVAVLVFIVGSPAGDATFSSSDPAKVMLKAGAVTDSGAEIRLQNITGGNIDVTDSSMTGGFAGAACTLNDSALPNGSSSTEVVAGGEMDISCSGMAEGQGTLTLQYTDYAGLQRQVDITLGGSGASADASLVAYYAFSEGSGTIAGDSAGSNDGTLENFDCTTGLDCDLTEPISNWTSSGISGNALSFDGVDAYVDSGTTFTAIDYSRDYSLCFWFNYDIRNDHIFRQIRNSNDRLEIHIDGADTTRLHFGHYNGSSFNPVRANTGLTAGTWYHICVTNNGTDQTQKKIYLNGTDDTGSGIAVSPGGEPVSFRIGSHSFDGRIDEVRIYNRILSAAEVCSLCNALASCGC